MNDQRPAPEPVHSQAPQSSPIPATPAPKKRRMLGIILNSAFLLFSLSLFFFGLKVIYWPMSLVFRDIPPPNDAHLMLPKLSIPESENAYYDLLRASSSLPSSWEMGKAVFQDSLSSDAEKKEWDHERVAKAMEEYGEVLMHLRLASERRVYQTPLYEDPQNISMVAPLPDVVFFARMADIVITNAEMLRRNGDALNAANEAFTAIRLGHLMSEAPQDKLVIYLGAGAIKNGGIDILERIMSDEGVDRDVQSYISNQIGRYRDSGSGLSNAFRNEYYFSKHAILNLISPAVEADARYIFQKNKTLSYVISDTDSRLKQINTPCDVFVNPTPKFRSRSNTESNWFDIFKTAVLPNGVGKIIADMFTVAYGSNVLSHRCELNERITKLEALGTASSTTATVVSED